MFCAASGACSSEASTTTSASASGDIAPSGSSAEDVKLPPIDADLRPDLAADPPDSGAVEGGETTETGGGTCSEPGTPAASAGCLVPTHSADYYVGQALAYFDTLDVDAPATNVPAYSELVARWEWPPWLLLTGYGKQVMIDTAAILRQGDPSTVPTRDCRYFKAQPFARCRVSFLYAGGSCPIYEEFVFNDAGEMTFIEAWSDVGDLRPTSPDDPWAEAAGFARLSTKIPGLGFADGQIDLDGAAMTAAADADKDVRDFVVRAHDFWGTWLAEYNGADDGFFARGCGW